jgi:hypothetical protein
MKTNIIKVIIEICFRFTYVNNKEWKRYHVIISPGTEGECSEGFGQYEDGLCTHRTLVDGGSRSEIADPIETERGTSACPDD